MIILAIDASGPTAGAALVTEERTLSEFNVSNGLTHSRTLMELVSGVIEAADFDMTHVDYVAATNGPGSFTGLRIGAACAKGLAAGLGKAMVMVPALDALAYNVFMADGYIVPILDARRGEVYSAAYRRLEGELDRVTEYLACPLEQVLEAARSFGGPVTFLGDGVAPNMEKLLESGFFIAPPNLRLQRAASVGMLALKLAAQGKTVLPRDFKLSYIRKPQAEREYDAKAGRRSGD